MGLPRCMLLHSLAGCVHCNQDARIGRHNNTAWEDVAEDEQRHGVRACRAVLIGQAPVDATSRAIRLWSVFPPVGQRRAGEQEGIDPSTGNQQTAMRGAEPVSCEDRLDLYLAQL